MTRSWYGITGILALALAIAASVSGCTTLLGDFSSRESTTNDGGQADASTDEGGADSASPQDSSGSGDVMSAADSPDDSSSACAPGQLACAAGCVSTSDLHTCGACNNDCTLLTHVVAAGLTCASGVCTSVCVPGYAHCSSNPGDVCETDLSTTDHCGSCTTVCGSSTPVCALSNGTYACASGCPAGTDLCSGSCANLMTDDADCGQCGNACTGGMTCQQGSCACPASLTNCRGTCFETDGDPTHCGTSCTACPVPGNGGTATCSQGNCGVACKAGYSACSGTTPCAFDTNNDATHCGPSCVTCGSGEICSNGGCACAAGLTDCGGGTCVNTATNANNCGSCGNVCPDGLCKNSTCTCVAIRCGSTSCGCGASCCKVGATLTCCAAP